MDIRIEEQDDLYCVCVKVEAYNPRTKRKIIVTTGQVRREAERMGYAVGNAVQETRIHNLSGVTQGTWFFEKKTLDKPVEDVIIEEEKKVKPKPARKKRTRSPAKKRVSTKKPSAETVSTED